MLPCKELSWVVITVFASVNSDVRPSLVEKRGSGRWQWGCSLEGCSLPYFWNAFTVHPVAGNLLAGERDMPWEKHYEYGHGWHFLFLSTQSWAFLLLLFYTAISLLLSGLFPYWVRPGLLLSLPGLSTGFLLQSIGIWVKSCPLLDSDSLFISLEFVWLHGIWHFQGQLYLAPCLAMPCGAGIFDNHSCKEPVGI